MGAAGCLWIDGCSAVLWRLGGFGAVVFGALLSLESSMSSRMLLDIIVCEHVYIYICTS